MKVIDVNSSNTETVKFNSQTCTAGGGVASLCTLSLATSNAHSSYILQSGTCGLRKALKDLGTSGGEVIVDQRFYDEGWHAGYDHRYQSPGRSGTSVGPVYQKWSQCEWVRRMACSD